MYGRTLRFLRYGLLLVIAWQLGGSRSDAQGTRFLAITDVGNMRLVISNCGTLATSFNARNPSGMEWPAGSGIDHLTRGGLWVGAIDASTGDTLVTIGARDAYYLDPIFHHSEFTPVGGRPRESSRLPGSPYFRPGTVSDENFHTAYVDTLPIVKGSGEEAHTPMGIRVIEETYSWGADPLDDFVIAEFNVVNTGPRSLQGVWIGIYSEMVTNNRLAAWPSWPPGARWFDFQDPHWDAALRVLWNHNIENRFVSVDVRGAIQIVGSGGSGAYGRGPDSVATKRVTLTAWNWSPSRFVTWTDDSLYVRMSTGRAANLDSLFDPGTEDSPVSILAVGPFDLIAPGDTVQVVFALLAGENEVDLAQNAFWAQEAYDNRYNLPVTPITVEDLAVVVLENGVHVTWRLSDEALARALGVVVQRGEFPEGPFESTTAGLLQPERDMEFEDLSVEVGQTYWYRIALVLSDGSEMIAGPVRARVPGAAPETLLHTPIEVLAGAPIRIRYSIGPSSTPTRLGVYSVRGQLVRVLDQGVREPGEHEALWDRHDQNGNPLPRGIYWVQLETMDKRVAGKISLLW